MQHKCQQSPLTLHLVKDTNTVLHSASKCWKWLIMQSSKELHEQKAATICLLVISVYIVTSYARWCCAPCSPCYCLAAIFCLHLLHDLNVFNFFIWKYMWLSLLGINENKIGMKQPLIILFAKLLDCHFFPFKICHKNWSHNKKRTILIAITNS